ncbi:galactose oxidase-like domain-containing protein [Luedemannella helvata]
MREMPRGLRRRRFIMGVLAVVVILGANTPPAWSYVSDYMHDQLINSDDYKSRYGKWDVIELPPDVRVNAIHAALLPTGRILIIAGSGNDTEQFAAGTFKSLVYDPATGRTRLISTPTDIFCAGHAFLPDGKLLVAGGTLRYEVLEPQVTRAAGLMVVKNESPNGGPRVFPKGTEFVSPAGKKFTATSEFTVQPATKVIVKGGAKVTASTTSIWVESTVEGPSGVTPLRANYKITGLIGQDRENIYGLNEKMTLDKQDFQGRREAFEFNPYTEQYERVGDMAEQRWYPTLTGLPDGRVIAVSGLDGAGQVVPGINEIYDPKTKAWTERKDLQQYFPTYPAIFQTAKPGVLFYSGSNSGYGPATKGRDPAFWDLRTNKLTLVPGIRDADMLETSGSVWVGPVQDQKLMVVGGGGVGDSPKSTARIDIVDLDAETPRFTPGPDLPEAARYPILVTLPDDTTLISNGSKGYRGRGASDNNNARIYHPDTNTLSYAADPNVGRDYHSAGVLLPDGRVLTVGSNPLFADKLDTITAPFEQRLEVFTPAYLYQGGVRPAIMAGPDKLSWGKTGEFTTSDPSQLATARLLRPGASTHVTDVEQRSVALEMTPTATGVKLTVPKQRALVPPGPYMLFLTDKRGVPSVAHWVFVG